MYDTKIRKEINKLQRQYTSRAKAKTGFQNPDKQIAETSCCIFSPGLQSFSVPFLSQVKEMHYFTQKYKQPVKYKQRLLDHWGNGQFELYAKHIC